MAELESWKNAIPGRVVLKKFNGRGEVINEVIPSGKVVHLLPAERRMNQEVAANADLDFFRNGMMTPVRLLDSEEDTKEIASNPNLLTTDTMVELLGGDWEAFIEKVESISNATTLDRFREVAREHNAKVLQVQVIEDRLAEVDPHTYAEVIGAGEPERQPRAVTPK